MLVTVTYWQDFMGETLKDTYKQHVNDNTMYQDIEEIKNALLSDPHVYKVRVEPEKEQK